MVRSITLRTAPTPYLVELMVPKLSSRQQAQLAWLDTVGPRLDRVRHVIEAMAIMQADDVMIRQLGRLLDEIKSGAQAQGFGALSETAGIMATMSRRGGGLQMKVRGLRELSGSLAINLEGAIRQASVPERDDGAEG